MEKEKREHWIHAIFDQPVSKVCKYNVEAMFLQLIAANLISINTEEAFVVSRDSTSVHAFPPFRYEHNYNWVGIRLLTGERSILLRPAVT